MSSARAWLEPPGGKDTRISYFPSTPPRAGSIQEARDAPSPADRRPGALLVRAYALAVTRLWPARARERPISMTPAPGAGPRGSEPAPRPFYDRPRMPSQLARSSGFGRLDRRRAA